MRPDACAQLLARVSATPVRGTRSDRAAVGAREQSSTRASTPASLPSTTPEVWACQLADTELKGKHQTARRTQVTRKMYCGGGGPPSFVDVPLLEL